MCSRQETTTTPVPLSQSTAKPWWKRHQTKTSESSKLTSTTTSPKPPKVDLPETKNDLVENNSLVEDLEHDKCEDRITNIAGSMSCKAFLRSFAYQYCKHKYIKKNCCESHKRYCTGSTHG